MTNYVSPRDLADALEFGAWKKGVGALGSSEVGYCCLGVACELAGHEYKLDWSYIHDPNCGHISFYMDPITPLWAPWLTDDVQGWLSQLNDCSSTFAPVVDCLREMSKEIGE